MYLNRENSVIPLSLQSVDMDGDQVASIKQIDEEEMTPPPIELKKNPKKRVKNKSRKIDVEIGLYKEETATLEPIDY